MHRLPILPSVVGIMLAWQACPSFAQSPPVQNQIPKIWAAPNNKFTTDFNALFTTNQPTWSQDSIRSAIKVFKFYPNFLAEASNTVISQTLSALKNNGVSVALEGSMLIAQNLCGVNYAGDSGQWTLDILSRIKKLGFTIDILAMNEPVLHIFRVCQNFPLPYNQIPDLVAQSIKPVVSGALATFPKIIIGDIEATYGFGDKIILGNYMNYVIASWPIAYKKQNGPLAFFHADVDWNRPTPYDGIVQAAHIMAANGVPFGVIYNGTSTDTSSKQWILDGILHYQTVESSSVLATFPHDVIIQSWDALPNNFFQPYYLTTFSGFIASYLQWRSLNTTGKYNPQIPFPQ